MGVNVVKLKDIVDVLNGYAFKSSKYVSSGYRVMRITNVQKGTLVDDDPKYYEQSNVLDRYELRVGDILISLTGNVGRVGLVEESILPAYLNQRVGCLRIKSDEVCKEYLFHWLNNDSFEDNCIRNSNGIAQLNMSTEWLKDVEIQLPSLDEQKKIAKILDKADEIRAKKKLANDKLDEFLKSTFISMFGTPIANEKHWEVKKLKELTTKIMSGNTPKGGSQVYVPSGIEFYRSQNVWKNRIEKDDIAYIDEATHKKMERSSLKHNDILITKTGRINTENSSLGRSALYEGEDDKANINGHVYLVRLKEGMCHRFILTILTSNEYREHIRSVCVGGIDKRQLNKEHIEDFPIIYPPIEDQNKFAQIVEKVEAQKQKNELVIEQMNNLFNSLSQRAFKGEL